MMKNPQLYKEQLKGFCVELLEYFRLRAPADAEAFVTAALSVVHKTSSKSGLQQIVRDLLEMTLRMSEVEVRELDSRLASRNLPTLSAMRDSEGRQFREILLRRRIRGEDEFRFVEARLADVEPTGPSDAERELANQLLLSYKP